MRSQNLLKPLLILLKSPPYFMSHLTLGPSALQSLLVNLLSHLAPITMLGTQKQLRKLEVDKGRENLEEPK